MRSSNSKHGKQPKELLLAMGMWAPLRCRCKWEPNVMEMLQSQMLQQTCGTNSVVSCHKWCQHNFVEFHPPLCCCVAKPNCCWKI